MLADERQSRIIELLREEGTVYTSDLVNRFQTSRETIRRDLSELEQKGALKKVYGGATGTEASSGGRPSVLAPYEKRIRENLSDKESVAEAVLPFIREGMAIALDSSTTNLVIFRRLRKEFHNLHIITNSLPIAEELGERDEIEVVMLGGNLDRKEHCALGQVTLGQLRNYHADLYFMSCCGVTLRSGITDIGEGELQVKQAMMEMAERTILVCSHVRFGRETLLRVCGTNAVSLIVTDGNLPEETKEMYEKEGMHIVCGPGGII